jgi:hypothetical protein
VRVCIHSGRKAIVVNPPPKKNMYIATTDDAMAIVLEPRNIVPIMVPSPAAHTAVAKKIAIRATQ